MKKSFAIIVLLIALLCGCSTENRAEEEKNGMEVKETTTVQNTVVEVSADEADKVIDEAVDDLSNVLDDASDLVDYTREHTFESDSELKAYEAQWKDAANRVADIVDNLTGNRPPEKYQDQWDNIVSNMQAAADALMKASQLDANGDGVYEAEEAQETLQNALYEFSDAAKEALNCAQGFKDAKAESDLENYQVQKIVDRALASAPSNNDDSSDKVCITCGKSANHTYINPFSGNMEYYCNKHYNEIVGTLSEMEADVGKSNQSKHSCEECSREGTHIYYSPITGEKEYYCTKHYEELKEMMSTLGN